MVLEITLISVIAEGLNMVPSVDPGSCDLWRTPDNVIL